MEPGRGGGDGAGRVGVDGLVAEAVFGVDRRGGAFDVGGQRDLADLREEVQDIGGVFESESGLAFAVFLKDFGVQGGGLAVGFEEGDFGAWADTFAWADEGPPVVALDFLGEEDFEGAAGAGFMAAETGGDDAGVIDDEDVATAEEGGEVGEAEVLEGAGGAVHGQEPGLVTFPSGELGDQLGWQVIVELVRAHGQGVAGNLGGGNGYEL